MTFDYVVVGAGAAGCVLASRLTEDPGVSVLLVESGGPARTPFHAVPRAFYVTLRGDRYVHRYPAGGAAGVPPEGWVRGRGLGGSTAVNGLMYVRGAAADFDALEAAGNPGWGSEAFARAYLALEDHALGAGDGRGVGGPLRVSVPEATDEVARAVFEGAEAVGLSRVRDFNASDGERVAPTPATIARGRRVSAATAFLGPPARRPNLTIATRAHAERVLFSGDRARGVRLRRGGRFEEVAARREVLVCAGTVESPLLLERSGIGARDVLRAAGIECRVDSPRVGEDVIEQRAVSMQVRFDGRLGLTERLSTLPRQALAGAHYLATRNGPLATSGYDVVSAFRASADADRPDAQGVWVPIALDERSRRMRLARYSGLLFTGWAIRPTTAGSIHSASPDASAAPHIEADYLRDEAEQRTTGGILAHARAVLAASPLADRVAAEVFPGPDVAAPDDVVAFARASGSGIYHAIGSCAMGPAPDSVVDPDLRVRGVEGLRVVDASVLPLQVSGNPAAPVYALAWLAAERVAP